MVKEGKGKGEGSTEGEGEGLLKKTFETLKEVKEVLSKALPTEGEEGEGEGEGSTGTEGEEGEGLTGTEGEEGEGSTGTEGEEGEEGEGEVNPTEFTSKDIQKIIKRQDVLEQKAYKQEQIIQKQNKQIKTLTNDKTATTHKSLVKKALDFSKELHDETVIDEESLIKEVKSVLELPEDKDVTDSDISTYIKGLEIARKKVPKGFIPVISDSTIHKEQTDTKAKIKEHRDKMNKQGVVE
jgi:hypothetical protein